jgi:hypothetical protein
MGNVFAVTASPEITIVSDRAADGAGMTLSLVSLQPGPALRLDDQTALPAAALVETVCCAGARAGAAGVYVAQRTDAESGAQAGILMFRVARDTLTDRYVLTPGTPPLLVRSLLLCW